MKLKIWRFIVVLFAFCSLNVSATTHYVNESSTNATPPYTDWTTAAVNIQDAINASVAGDTVLVTNGVYAGGGQVITGGLTNRVALTSAITVQSVNGPWATIIQGAGATNGSSAVRCAWLTNNATLIGFTLEWGATASTDLNGGGVWCASSNAVVDNCVIVSNTAVANGFGVYQGTLNNCLISSNGGVSFNPAVYNAVLNSCTVVGNTHFGVVLCAMTNCIVYYNAAQNYSQISSSAYCCATPLLSGPGNFTNAPQLFADGVHLLSTSPCVSAGTNFVAGTDIFGQAWANPPSVGCAQYYPSPLIATPQIILTGNPFGFAVNAIVGGATPMAVMWLQDGVALQDNGDYLNTQTTNLIVTVLSVADAGNYQLVASNAFGVVTSAVAQLVVHCVDAAGLSPVAPYLTWATAATNIQDAITASLAGDFVLVTNGLYATGGISMDGVVTNRVSVDEAIRVQSVNGPWVTTIQGARDPVSTNGPAAVRCVWLTNNAALSGFTLKSGATRTNGAASSVEGGGMWSASSNAVVDNCVIVSNTASSSGAAVYQGTLNNCLIYSNGVGAVSYASVNSCTIAGNGGEGVFKCTMTNCVIYYNSPENFQSVVSAAYCCATPLLSGAGNFTNAPQLFADGVHLLSTSRCIGAGTNLVIGTDIFGRAWANPPSVGCAEFNPSPIVTQPQLILTGEPPGFNFGNVVVGGQPPFAFLWLQNGVPLQGSGNFVSAQLSSLVATGVSFADAGSYQLVVSNAAGMVTSAVAQLIIHAVDAAGVNPEPPFLTWDTAATNINDAINAASAGDIVLVTNGIYDTGGESMDGVITNRVSINKPLLVIGVNGYANTAIQGAWDPVTTNGPGAVRCAWLTNGAFLNGFTLRNGATRNAGGTATAQSGGGAWCASTNALVSNCLLTSNSATDGGGIAFGTLDNSLVVRNLAALGGGAFNSTLNNCTVVYNSTTEFLPGLGGGTYNQAAPYQEGTIQNCIVLNNTADYFEGEPDNYSPPLQLGLFSYSCTADIEEPAPPGTGNTAADPQFVDLYHLSINSPCRGTGSALYAGGTDFDGEPWNNPPSMGCSEVVISNLIGPLSVTLTDSSVGFPQTNVLVNHFAFFVATITGRAAYVGWNFGDGPVITNAGHSLLHAWTNAGVYNVVFTAYNNDNPAGVSANTSITVLPVNPPQLQSPSVISNSIQFQFTGQVNANYTVQYATHLAPPVSWKALPSFFSDAGGTYQVTDSIGTNVARFYRVLAQ